jgi:hypothetical protein
MIDASSTSLHPKQSNLIDKLVDQHIVDAFLSTHTSARSRDVETLNSSNSCRVRFDRSGARVTGLTGGCIGVVKACCRHLGRDPVGGGAPRVALRSARPLRTSLIVAKTNKESTRLEKLGLER